MTDLMKSTCNISQSVRVLYCAIQQDVTLHCHIMCLQLPVTSIPYKWPRLGSPDDAGYSSWHICLRVSTTSLLLLVKTDGWQQQ